MGIFITLVIVLVIGLMVNSHLQKVDDEIQQLIDSMRKGK